MSLKTFLSGLSLSLPAGLLVWAGVVADKEPTSWVLWGIAALVGFPGSVMVTGLLFTVSIVLSATSWLPEFLKSMNLSGWAIFPFVAAFSIIAGAHLNGMILIGAIKSHNKHLQPTQAPRHLRD